MMKLHSPTTKAELKDGLDTLVKKAYQNGVDVADAGYELHHQESTIPNWDLTIIRLE